MIRAALTLAILLTAHGAAAKSIVILAGHLVDPKTATIQRDMRVTVDGGNITAVAKNEGPTPAGVNIIDLSGAYVLPGLMDTHSHLSLEVAASKIVDSDATAVLRAQRNAREIVESGFTTVRDMGEKGYVVTDLRRAIEAGWTSGPTIVNAGRMIGPFGGHHGQHSPPVPYELGNTWSATYIQADTPDQIVKAVRENIFFGAKVLKVVADPKGLYYTEREIRAAADEAHRAGLKLAVHVGGGQPARNAILGGADSLEHAFDLGPDDFKLMKERGTFLSTTNFAMAQLLVIFRGDETAAKAWGGRIQQRLRLAHQAGVKIAFGTDVVWAVAPGLTRGDAMHDMVLAYREAGVPDADTLRAMTTTAAELIGVEKDSGAIRPTYRADIIAVAANPLSDITTLRRPMLVMARGKIIVERNREK